MRRVMPALLAAACLGEMRVPDDVLVSCEEERDCPSGRVCRFASCTTLLLGGPGEPCTDDGRCDTGNACREDVCRPVSSEESGLVFARPFAGDGAQTLSSLAADAAGNTYALGTFGGTVDFGAGPVKARGRMDLFLVRRDAQGVVAWVKTFGGSDGLSLWAASVAVSADGTEVVLTAHGDATLDFGGGPVGIPVGSAIFLAALDASGAHRWSHAYGSGNGAQSASVVLDQQGEIFLAGSFFGELDLGTGALSAGGWGAVYLARFSATGTVRWVRQFGKNEQDFTGTLSLDAGGQPMLLGTLEESVVIGTTTLHNEGQDLFLAKFDRDGQALWAKPVRRTRGGSATLAWAPDGDLIVATNFAGRLETAGTTAAGDSVQLALIRWDPEGRPKWIRSIPAGDGSSLEAVAVAPDGRIAVAGGLSGSVDLGTGALASLGDVDALVAAFDPNGQALFAVSYGAPGDQWGLAVAFGASTDLFCAGTFETGINFGAGTILSDSRTAFVARIRLP